jgi:flavorubredoxin
LKVVCPSHGPVLRTGIRKYMDLYRKWSAADKAKVPLALIAYVSAYGNTGKLAKQIAKGLESAGIETVLRNLQETGDLDMLALAERADAIIAGSPTINGDAVKPVWDMLAGLATIKLKGKVGASFGSYGWSGEGPKMLSERMKSLKFNVPLEPLRAVLVPSSQELDDARVFGVKLAVEIRKASETKTPK